MRLSEYTHQAVPFPCGGLYHSFSDREVRSRVVLRNSWVRYDTSGITYISLSLSLFLVVRESMEMVMGTKTKTETEIKRKRRTEEIKRKRKTEEMKGGVGGGVLIYVQYNTAKKRRTK